MSLITDQDYFLQALRLAFLRVEAPLGAYGSQPTSLIQSAPFHALSQHAITAGLHPHSGNIGQSHHAGPHRQGTGVADFGLARSPGPIPLTSSATPLGRSTGYNTPSNGGSGAPGRPNRLRRRQSDGRGDADRRVAGLNYSQTIVGRHDNSLGAVDGPAHPKPKGKRSSWKPKPHQLAKAAGSPYASGELNDEAGDYSTRQPASANGITTPHLTIDSPDGTPQPGQQQWQPVPRSDSRQSMQEDSDSEYDNSEEEEAYNPERTFDNFASSPLQSRPSYRNQSRPRGDSEASSASGLMAPLDRALANQLSPQPYSPTVSAYPASSPDLHGADAADQDTSLTQAAEPIRDDEHPSRSYLQDARATASRPDTAVGIPDLSLHPSPSDVLVRPRSRKDTGASSDAALGDIDSDEEEIRQRWHERRQSQQHQQVQNGAKQGARLRSGSLLESLSEGEETPQDDDLFQFSLHGRHGGSSSSLEATSFAPSATRADALQDAVSDLYGQSTLVSPPNHAKLPAIAEASEIHEAGQVLSTDEQRDDTSGHPGPPVDAEDAALRAAQMARRRARRRVNISGRVALPLSLPASPPEGSLPNGPQTPGTPVSARSVMRNGSSSPSLVHRSAPPSPGNIFPVRPPLSPLQNIKPVSPTASLSNATGPRPLSPASNLHNQLLRSRPSTGVRTRQRSKTDPAPLSIHALSQPTTPTSTGFPVRGPKSALRNPVHSATSIVGSPEMASPASEIDTAIIPAEEEDGYLTEPVKRHLVRSQSTGPNAGSLTALRTVSAPEAVDSLTINTSADPRQARQTTVASSYIAPSPELSRPKSSTKHSHKKEYDPYIAFPITRQEVVPFIPPKTSALSAMLKSADAGSDTKVDNPFNEFYGALFTAAPVAVATGRYARRGAAAPASNSSLSLSVYYPFSRDPAKPVKMHVKPDLIVEEIIGCALWKYWEERRQPSICPDTEGANDAKWDERSDDDCKLLKVTNWVLRIAEEEEDGAVDDDFPAPDRSRTAKGFGTCFALVKATDSQARANQASDGQIERRPSRVIKRIKRMAPLIDNQSTLALPSLAIPPNSINGAANTIAASYNATTPSKASFATAAGTNVPLVYLRVRIPLKGVEAITTTVQVPRDMYLADVLDLICRKKNLESSKEWILMVPDRGLVVPLDRTVESLQGVHHLALAKRGTSTSAATASASAARTNGLQNTNPNASIFKRLSEVPQPRYVSAADLDSNYRTYIVQRKMPMPLGRHERIFSIDNDYIHIMPSDTKLTSNAVRTASYHISQIAMCKITKRIPSNFKLIVWRDKDRDVKRYDFEAANVRTSTEITQIVQELMQAWKENVERDRNAF